MLPTKVKLWTVEDYHHMVETGVLTGSDRVELLEGQIIEMTPQLHPTRRRLSAPFATSIDYWKPLLMCECSCL